MQLIYPNIHTDVCQHEKVVSGMLEVTYWRYLIYLRFLDIFDLIVVGAVVCHHTYQIR